MKLKIRYEDQHQTIELNTEDTENLWVSLSLEEEDLSAEENERKIQEAFEKGFNRPDYNNWHKFDRHWGISKAKAKDGDEEIESSEPLMDEVVDERIFLKDEIEREKKADYEDLCERIRSKMKPKQADLIIAIAIDGMTPAEYAEATGDTANNVSHRYRRAVNKFKEIFSYSSF